MKLLINFIYLATFLCFSTKALAVTPTVQVERYLPQNYVVDGSKDYGKQLEKAVNAAAGGSLYFPKGIILISSNTITVPDNTTIDLNGSNLVFTIRDDAKCLVIGNNDTVKNGKVTCSGISASGAGDRQTPIVIGNYAENNGTGKHNILIQNLQIASNRYDGNGIGIFGDSYNITLKNILFKDSMNLARPILVHWGNPDNYTNGTTHPHDINISDINVYNMEYDKTSDTGAIFLSGAYNISVNNINIDGITNGIFVYCGDYAYDYSHSSSGNLFGQGISISNVTAKNVRNKGVYLLGKSSKNNSRADMPVAIANSTFSGQFKSASSGIYLNNVKGVNIDDCNFSNFERGLLTGSGVENVIVSNSIFYENSYEGVLISGGAIKMTFKECNSFKNGININSTASSGFRVVEGKEINFLNCNIGNNDDSESQMFGIRLEDNGKVHNISIIGCSVKALKVGGTAYSIGTINSRHLLSRFQNNGTSGNTKFSNIPELN